VRVPRPARRKLVTTSRRLSSLCSRRSESERQEIVRHPGRASRPALPDDPAGEAVDGVERLAQPPLGLHVQQPLDDAQPSQRLARGHEPVHDRVFCATLKTFTNSALPGAAMLSSVKHTGSSPNATYAADAVEREALQNVQRPPPIPSLAAQPSSGSRSSTTSIEPDGVGDEAPELVAEGLALRSHRSLSELKMPRAAEEVLDDGPRELPLGVVVEVCFEYVLYVRRVGGSWFL
jgi:hypothetical protein